MWRLPARDALSADNTDHFDDQATNFWYGIDRYKSGLNALLSYIDSGATTKAIEVRNKFQQGDSYVSLDSRDQRAAQGVRPQADLGVGHLIRAPRSAQFSLSPSQRSRSRRALTNDASGV